MSLQEGSIINSRRLSPTLSDLTDNHAVMAAAVRNNWSIGWLLCEGKGQVERELAQKGIDISVGSVYRELAYSCHQAAGGQLVLPAQLGQAGGQSLVLAHPAMGNANAGSHGSTSNNLAFVHHTGDVLAGLQLSQPITIDCGQYVNVTVASGRTSNINSAPADRARMHHYNVKL